MLGQNVSIPVSVGSDVEGVVIKYDPETGEVTVKDDEGHEYKGFEYQALVIW